MAALGLLRERLQRRALTGPVSWTGTLHGPDDERSRVFGWVGQVASILQRDASGDKGTSNNAELLMAFEILDSFYHHNRDCNSLAERQVTAVAALRLCFKWTGQITAAFSITQRSDLGCTVDEINTSELALLAAMGWALHDVVSPHDVLFSVWPLVAPAFARSTRTAKGRDRAVDALIVVGGDHRCLGHSPFECAVAAIAVSARLLDVDITARELLDLCSDEAESQRALHAIETCFEVVRSIIPEKARHKLDPPSRCETVANATTTLDDDLEGSLPAFTAYIDYDDPPDVVAEKVKDVTRRPSSRHKRRLTVDTKERPGSPTSKVCLGRADLRVDDVGQDFCPAEQMVWTRGGTSCLRLSHPCSVLTVLSHPIR